MFVKMSPYLQKTLMIAGFALLINGLFLPWISFAYTAPSFVPWATAQGGQTDTSVMGFWMWGDLTINNFPYVLYTVYASYALIALGTAALCSMLFDKPKFAFYLAGITVILSLFALFMTMRLSSDYVALSGPDKMKYFDFLYSNSAVSFGAYLHLTGSFITLLSSILGLSGLKDMNPFSSAVPMAQEAKK